MHAAQAPRNRRIVIVGGGISGLAAAHRTRELNPAAELTLLEAAEQLGGVLQTVRRDGYLIERSADNFITNLPWAVELCRRIGFEQELLPTNESLRRAFVARAGRLLEVPQGFVLMAPKQLRSVLTTPLLSPLGKLRLAWEYFVPRGAQEDESVASFVRRRLGRETYERLVEPLVGGIYTADSEQLSLAAALPQFREMERKHGGLIRAARADAAGMRNNDSGARYSMFVAPRGGMSSLIEALARTLPAASIRLQTAVESLTPRGAGEWTITLRSGEPLQSDAVILATPAPQTARLLAGVDAELARLVGGISCASSAVVTLAYRREQIARPLDGFGFVVPAIEHRPILAGSFSSLKFPDRAPQGDVLIRVFLGGALHPELLERSDAELESIAERELAELIGTRGAPRFALTTRWSNTMPQYHVGHLARLEQIDARLAHFSSLALAGNAYRGVGVPQCIRSGEQAAERVAGKS